MSAWIVSRTHIDLLVTAGLDLPGRDTHGGILSWYVDGNRHTLTTSNADEIGQMVWAENVASVSHRYPDDGPGDLPGPNGFHAADVLLYSHTWVRGIIDPTVVLRAIDCYEYQSCEHPGWKASRARAFCVALQEAAVGQLPGYDQAPWSFDDADYFLTGVRT